MTSEISFMRQKDIFNPVNQKFKIVVLGAGSLGSFITLNLAKLGFSNISVYDYDKVENYNIPNQFYRLDDISKFKVEALADIIKQFTGVEITQKNERVVESTKFPITTDIIYILTFDNLENRRLFYNIIKDTKCWVIDARAGGEEYNIRVVDTFDEKDLNSWDKSLNIVPTQLPCGARSIIYTNLSIAAEVCNIVKKINNDEEFPKRLVRHMKYYKILGGQNEEKNC